MALTISPGRWGKTTPNGNFQRNNSENDLSGNGNGHFQKNDCPNLISVGNPFDKNGHMNSVELLGEFEATPGFPGKSGVGVVSGNLGLKMLLRKWPA